MSTTPRPRLSVPPQCPVYKQWMDTSEHVGGATGFDWDLMPSSAFGDYLIHHDTCGKYNVSASGRFNVELYGTVLVTTSN